MLNYITPKNKNIINYNYKCVIQNFTQLQFIISSVIHKLLSINN